MKIDIITLFPEMFEGPFGQSIIRRGMDKGLVEIAVHQLRDWAEDKHRLTDDRPFGGGPGMVLMAEPLFNAVEALRARRQETRDKRQEEQQTNVTEDDGAESVEQLTSQTPDDKKTKVILMTPTGKPFKQAMAQDLSKEEHLIIICGRYEGVDQRVIDELVDMEISIGDYVLSGGELPAMVVTDAIVRLIPGVLGAEESLETESFNTPLLDHPQYTQPANFRGLEVPEVLRSGDHGKIAEWRKVKAEEMTKKVRRDLWEEYSNK